MRGKIRKKSDLCRGGKKDERDEREREGRGREEKVGQRGGEINLFMKNRMKNNEE